MVAFYASRYLLNGCSVPASKSISQSLLISNGFIHPVGKGLYSLLPLGQRVVDKLSRIIDKELESIGALKMSTTILGPKELWDKTGRWDNMGSELMQLNDRAGSKYCLQPTAEEMITQIVSQLPQLKKSTFPLMLYQTSDKFRDEMNPRFGLLRARQFIMKDLYSFDLNDDSAKTTYNQVLLAYKKILKDRLQLEVFKVPADSGVHGGRLSDEFHIKNSLGEDGIHFCKICKKGVKVEDFKEMPACEKCSPADHETLTTVEIGHTFQLGTKYSESLKAYHSGEPLNMCCFGIGVSRLLPASMEALSPSDEVIRLPKAIAPFDAAIVVSKTLLSNVLVEMAISSIGSLMKGGVLVDDRVDQSIGKRLKELNKIGIPRIVVLGKVTESTLNDTPKIEYLTTEPHNKDLMAKGEFTMSELMQILQ
ncbi:unnamed protein product [Auanema sp. JU1783]|nr:unnamed protein product [Auanema sp. JU1783]